VALVEVRAVDVLASAVQAIARGDAELGERARDDAAAVRQMLDEVVATVSQSSDEPETKVWGSAAVLVARHLDRVANNGAELGGRVRFMVTGEPFVRGDLSST